MYLQSQRLIGSQVGARVITDSRFLLQGDRCESLRNGDALRECLGVNLLLSEVRVTILLVTLARFVERIAILGGYLRHARRSSSQVYSLSW